MELHVCEGHTRKTGEHFGTDQVRRNVAQWKGSVSMQLARTICNRPWNNGEIGDLALGCSGSPISTTLARKGSGPYKTTGGLCSSPNSILPLTTFFYSFWRLAQKGHASRILRSLLIPPAWIPADRPDMFKDLFTHWLLTFGLSLSTDHLSPTLSSTSNDFGFMRPTKCSNLCSMGVTSFHQVLILGMLSADNHLFPTINTNQAQWIPHRFGRPSK